MNHEPVPGATFGQALSLGETTPGPLVMVVSFVGFVGGWTKAIFGSDALFLSGAAAAAVVTFFTFLAVFFAYHVLWAHGLSGRFDWPSGLIGLAAAIALFRFKLGVIPVIAGSAGAGLGYQLAHAALYATT
jgi:chromate transporter